MLNSTANKLAVCKMDHKARDSMDRLPLKAYRAMRARRAYMCAFVPLSEDFFARQNRRRNAILVDVIPPAYLGHFPQDTIAHGLANRFGAWSPGTGRETLLSFSPNGSMPSPSFAGNSSVWVNLGSGASRGTRTGVPDDSFLHTKHGFDWSASRTSVGPHILSRPLSGALAVSSERMISPCGWWICRVFVVS